MATDRQARGSAACLAVLVAACSAPPFPARTACDVPLPGTVVLDDLELADALAFGSVGLEGAHDTHLVMVVPVGNVDLEVVTVRVDCAWFDAAGVEVGSSPRQVLRLEPAACLDVRCEAPQPGPVRAVATFGWSR
ncbi:MAG: hypothetical protein U1F60_02685 [Planctomycetota bacterium]